MADFINSRLQQFNKMNVDQQRARVAELQSRAKNDKKAKQVLDAINSKGKKQPGNVLTFLQDTGKVIGDTAKGVSNLATDIAVKDSGVGDIEKQLAQGKISPEEAAKKTRDATLKYASDKSPTNVTLNFLKDTVQGTARGVDSLVRSVGEAGGEALAGMTGVQADGTGVLDDKKDPTVLGIPGSEGLAKAVYGEGPVKTVQSQTKDIVGAVGPAGYFAAPAIAGLDALGIAPVSAGTTKAVQVASKAGEFANEAAVAAHPAVKALDDHLATLNQARERLMAGGATERSPAVVQNSRAYSEALRHRSEVAQQVGERGSVGLGEPVFDTARLAKAKTPEEVRSILSDSLSPDVVQRVSPAISRTNDPNVITNILDIAQGKNTVKAPPIPINDIKAKASQIAQQLPDTPTGIPAPSTIPNTPTNQGITQLLDSSNAVKSPASKSAMLEHYRDPSGVLGSHFGKVGTDIGYKLQQGAKTVSDLQEVITPDIQAATKQLNKLAKSDAGKADIQSRVFQALEDRGNAGQYLKSKEEMDLFNTTAKVLDFFKKERETRGKAVIGDRKSVV